MVGPEEEGGEAGDGFLGMVFDAGPLGVGGGLASSVTLALQVSICNICHAYPTAFLWFFDENVALMQAVALGPDRPVRTIPPIWRSNMGLI